MHIVSSHSAHSAAHNICRARASEGVLCCSTAPAPVAASSKGANRVADARSVPGPSAPAKDSRGSLMSASVFLKERDVHRVVSSAVKTALAVPQHSWSADFVVETIMGEILSTCTSGSKIITEASAGSSPADISSNSNTDEGEPQTGVCSNSTASATRPSKKTSKGRNCSSSLKSGNSSREAACADGVHGQPAEIELMLAPEVAELLDIFAAAGAAEDAVEHSHFRSHNSSMGRRRRSDSDGEGQQQQQQQHESLEELQMMFSQLLYDNYQQVDDDDVNAFCHKLMTDLNHLVQQALQEQSEDMQGLCALCGRDMPLTKHHLIPRDVHKEYKKRGFTFDQLQSGIYVCRPCHSAIHGAVPDNKELAMHYRTLEDLRQHEAIIKFSVWASKQRVSSKADTSAKHFKYRK